jgi:protocatechuate 3,4-dioxygenase beta subunit
MPKNWLLLVLITHCLFAECLFSQDKKPIEFPKDPATAIAAMPITKPIADGQVITVIDGDTKKPIANADVIVITDARDEAFQKRGMELQKALRQQFPDRKQGRLMMVIMLGTRYQTNAQGIAKIPAGDDTVGVVVSGTRQAQWSPRLKGPLELFAPRFVTVQVLNSRGKPARNVEVGLGRQSNYFQATVRGNTDATGICKLELSDRQRGNDMRVAALIASTKSIEADFKADAIPDEPLQLHLPPCGQVRFILYGEDERPSKALKRAILNWTQPTNERMRGARMTHTQPSQLDPDGAMFSHVALNLDITVSAYIKDVPEALLFKAKGPTREHEMIIVDGRINTGPPIVSFRVLDQQGQPLANEALGKVLYSSDNHDYSFTKTDATGQITIAFQRAPPESIYLLRRSKSEGTDYRGAVRITLGELKPGKQTLGDVKLQDEPVIASGTVVDAQGKPVAGVWLRSKTTIVSGGSGGGSSGQEMWYHAHRVLTDEQGHFEIREVAPADHVLRVSVDSEDWAPLEESFTLNAGDKGETFRVGVATQLEGELLGELDYTSLRVKAINRATSKETTGYMRNGKYTIKGLPAGSYDIAFGRNADYKIEKVQSVKKGEAQDPRLRSDEWTKHFQVLETTITDENNKPLENVTVWYYVSRNNGRSGSGVRTDKEGNTRRLAPIKNSSIEVRIPGYEPQVFDKDLKDLKVKLLQIAAIEVQIIGMPKLPDGVFAQALVSHEGGRQMRSGTGAHLVNGRATVHPQGIGKCTLMITLVADYRRKQSNQVRNALRRALNLQPITFELTGTRKPTDPKVFKLDQDTIDNIQACLDDAREALKKKDK